MAETLDEQAVWRRVGAAAGEDDGRDRAGMGAARELAQLTAEKRRAAAICRRLLAGSGGNARRILQGVLRRLQNQAKTLEALYRFRTGQAMKRTGVNTRDLPKARGALLQTLLRETEQSAGRLEALAVRCTGQSARTLQALRDEDQRIFQTLLQLLAPRAGA